MSSEIVSRKDDEMSVHRRGRIPGHTPEPDFAAEQGVTLETQRKRRAKGDCPAYIVVARQVHYVDEDKPRYYKSLRVMPPRSGHAANPHRAA